MINRKTSTQINALLEAAFASNNSKLISPTILRETIMEVVKSCQAYRQYSGFGEYFDDEYISSSTQTLTQDTPTSFVVNKSIVQEDLPVSYANAGGLGFYDDTNGKIVFDSTDGMYEVTFFFDYGGATKGNSFFIKTNGDDGVSSYQIEEVSQTIPRTTASGLMVIKTLVRSTQDIYDNGITVLVETDDTGVTIWDRRIMVTRIN